MPNFDLQRLFNDDIHDLKQCIVARLCNYIDAGNLKVNMAEMWDYHHRKNQRKEK